MKKRSTASRQINGGKAWVQGRQAESLAISMLRNTGWKVILHRAKTPAGEIDIVATRADTLAFVEVKQRASQTQALMSLQARQQKRLVRAAEFLLSQHPEWCHDHIRFDLICVDQSGEATQYENIIQE